GVEAGPRLHVSTRRGAASMCVYLLEVIGNAFMRNVPLTVVARRHLRIALDAEQRAAVKELFHARPLRLRGCINVQWDRKQRAASRAWVLVFFVNDGLVVVV